MATATKTPAGLSDEQLGEVLALVKGADSVELKLTVPESGQRSTAAALEMDPLDAQIRQVFFFDTPELALNEAGSSCGQGGSRARGTTPSVKLRPIVPDALPEELRKSPNLVVEVDAMPGGPEGVELDDLSILGPIFVLKLKWSPRDFGRPLVAELWLYPDGSRILELSTKCATTEPMQVAAEARAFLGKKGVDLGGEQQTKTKTALEFFANELSVSRSS